MYWAPCILISFVCPGVFYRIHGNAAPATAITLLSPNIIAAMDSVRFVKLNSITNILSNAQPMIAIQFFISGSCFNLDKCVVSAIEPNQTVRNSEKIRLRPELPLYSPE